MEVGIAIYTSAQLESVENFRNFSLVEISGEMLEDGIGLVQIANFDARCAEETLRIIEDLLAQGNKSIKINKYGLVSWS